MKEETKDIIINLSSMGVAHYTRMQFSRVRMNWQQNLAMLLSSIVGVMIIHQLKIDELYKLTAVMVMTLIMPSIIRGIVKGGERSEEGIANKVEKNIDKL